MKLARSSFYYHPKGKSPEKMRKEADLRGKIEATYLEYLLWLPEGYQAVEAGRTIGESQGGAQADEGEPPALPGHVLVDKHHRLQAPLS